MSDSSRDEQSICEHSAPRPQAFVRKSLSSFVLKRIALFFAFMCLISIFYWAVGSFRFFLDESQLMILHFLRIVALGLCASALASIVFAVLEGLTTKRLMRLFGIPGYVFFLAFGVGCLVFSEALLRLSLGTG